MKKSFYLIPILLFFISCENNTNEVSTEQNNEDTQEVVIIEQKEIYQAPENFTKIKEVEGDLNNDGENEKVIIYNTVEGDLGYDRVIHILKKAGNDWTLWHQVNGPVMPSESGGMMGDPFSNILIMDNTLVIEHFGGASQKWMYTHYYRWIDEDDGFIVGFANTTYGSVCEKWDVMEYTLLGGGDGELISYTEIEDCDGNSKPKIENKKTYNPPVKIIKMEDFNPGDNQVRIDEKTIFYF